MSASTNLIKTENIEFVPYVSENQLKLLQHLIDKDLSEPYSLYTYRYFLNKWPNLCILAMNGEICVGIIICKLERDRQNQMRGYIAMLAVAKEYRNMQLGSTLVKLALVAMQQKHADLVVLETECSNKGALALYEKLNFTRSKRLHKYYLNGGDAFRLKLWFNDPFNENESESEDNVDSTISI
jgi:peptide alpha-N-acetyltransferase